MQQDIIPCSQDSNENNNADFDQYYQSGFTKRRRLSFSTEEVEKRKNAPNVDDEDLIVCLTDSYLPAQKLLRGSNSLDYQQPRKVFEKQESKNGESSQINDIIAKYRGALAAASQIVRGTSTGAGGTTGLNINKNDQFKSLFSQIQQQQTFKPAVTINQNLKQFDDKKRGRRPLSLDYRDEADDKILKSVSPGEKYGVNMAIVIQMAEALMKQTKEITEYVYSILHKTNSNLAMIQEKVKNLMVIVDTKLTQNPGSTYQDKRKYKEHVQHYSYFSLKDLQKQANLIQDTLCSLQNVEPDKVLIEIPELDFPVAAQEIHVDTKSKQVFEQAERFVAQARIMDVVNEYKQPVSNYNCCLQADLDNSVLMLSSETTDIDCYKISFNQRNETLELTFMQSFGETPYFFFTHGQEAERLIVDGVVYQMEPKNKICRKIQTIGPDFVGGCALERGTLDIVLSHGENLGLSLWTWQGKHYIKSSYHRFQYEKEKAASMLRYNRYAKGSHEIFCVSEEFRMIKLCLVKHSLEKTQMKKYLARNKRAILDYRILRSDRLIVLLDDDTLLMLDTYAGSELMTYSLAEMQHKNICCFSGDQINIDTYPYTVEDAPDGRLWLVNMKNNGYNRQIQRRTQIKFLSDFQPITQLQIATCDPSKKEEDDDFDRKISKMYVLGVVVHEQVLSLAEISTQPEQ